mmetsp:Transcript_39900/g.66353  ORF Transcript_39900/g.66353 Transcript_39900/m.66353 type:complete len:118 (+) Transcript_39900:304-657(+)
MAGHGIVQGWGQYVPFHLVLAPQYSQNTQNYQPEATWALFGQPNTKTKGEKRVRCTLGHQHGLTRFLTRMLVHTHANSDALLGEPAKPVAARGADQLTAVDSRWGRQPGVCGRSNAH